ncbi:MAG: metallophosphoesterase [Desulfobacteraceae bacterium]|jgi:5'-nucleotidase/UDP-sugar diphosphatase|nr:metallophosphoesterase [Desulfobacteraceae bacterium]
MKKICLLIACVLVVFYVPGCNDSNSSSKKDPTLQDGDIVSFSLLQTTDVHHRASGTGAFLTYSPADGVDSSGSGGSDQTEGGYARLTTKINDLRQAAEDRDIPTLLLDSGDFLMGTVYDLTMGDTPAGFYFLEYMNYDAATIGNHEFDYGPAGLAMIIDNALGDDGTGFTVPLIATNMETDGATGTDDDGIEALVASGTIQNTMVKTLDNGLKIGIIGLLGPVADGYAPLTPPLTFNHDYDFIQQQVDYLRNDLGAHIVVALSHSGVIDPNGTPSGDDVDLAQNVNGIDIIASGHEHQMTQDVVLENGTRIICAGNYGKNLAQLDVTVEIGTGITDAVLVNHPIDDSTTGDPAMNVVMDSIDAGINASIEPVTGLNIDTVIAGVGTDNLSKPSGAQETGMGNLVADSLRYLLQGTNGAVGIVANGVVRNGFEIGQQVTFADMYSVLPLGMTIDPAQRDIPGYPLMQVMLSGEHLKNMCQLNAYITASQDSAFMAGLAGSGDPALMGLASALSNLQTDYYLNLSGIQYSYLDAAGGYTVVPDSVKIYNGLDFTCQFPATEIVDENLYPCVFDIYMFMIVKSTDLQMLLTALELPITPLDITGEPVTMSNMLASRLDSDLSSAGIQEVKEWMALLTFLGADPSLGGFENHVIPDAVYGTETLAAGDGSRITKVSMTP